MTAGFMRPPGGEVFLPTMRSTRFCVNCDFAFLGRISPPERAILYCTIPFVEQQEHLAQRVEVCGIEVFSPRGPLHFFGQREVKVKGLRTPAHAYPLHTLPPDSRCASRRTRFMLMPASICWAERKGDA